MISSYEIIPKKGLGDLVFGMDMEKVVSGLGEPDEVDNFENEEEMNAVLLHYWEKGVSLFFEGHTRQIVAGMETDHPKATLYGKKIIGMPKEEVIALMEANGDSDYYEEEEDGELRLSFENQMMDFYIRDGKVAFVNWDVIVDSNGNIIKL